MGLKTDYANGDAKKIRKNLAVPGSFSRYPPIHNVIGCTTVTASNKALNKCVHLTAKNRELSQQQPQ
jgi:hypothetical protein